MRSGRTSGRAGIALIGPDRRLEAHAVADLVALDSGSARLRSAAGRSTSSSSVFAMPGRGSPSTGLLLWWVDAHDQPVGRALDDPQLGAAVARAHDDRRRPRRAMRRAARRIDRLVLARRCARCRRRRARAVPSAVATGVVCCLAGDTQPPPPCPPRRRAPTLSRTADSLSSELAAACHAALTLV